MCSITGLDITTSHGYNAGMKDYYQTLGVQESASPDELKKAYRSLAMQFHPDRNKSPEAESRFKEINEAYDTLGDENKRAQYDQTRQFGNPPGGFHFEFRGGGSPFGDIFEQIFRTQGFDPFGQQVPRNPNTQVQLNITLEEAFAGKSVPVQFTDSAGKSVNLVVNIPAGVESGYRLRYAGNGPRTHPTLPPGDLYITVMVARHPRFERDGPHLITNVNLGLWESLVGTEKKLATVEGGTIDLKIPALSRDGAVLRVKNKGMPMGNNSGNRGDLMVRLCVDLPKTLTDAQRSTIQSWIEEK
jgi:DnaJ-class molecular chaperone